MKNALALQQPSDAELLKMIAETNSSVALETLMLRYRQDIENISYRFLKRKVLRQDLHQNVFEKVCRFVKNGTYRETGRFPQLVHTLAYRIAKEMAAEEKHRSYGQEDFEYAEATIASPDPADDHVYDINIMLNILSRGQRKVMEKLLVEHKTNKETAEELEMTESGVRSVSSKAVHKWNEWKKYFREVEANG